MLNAQKKPRTKPAAKVEKTVEELKAEKLDPKKRRSLAGRGRPRWARRSRRSRWWGCSTRPVQSETIGKVADADIGQAVAMLRQTQATGDSGPRSKATEKIVQVLLQKNDIRAARLRICWCAAGTRCPTGWRNRP